MKEQRPQLGKEQNIVLAVLVANDRSDGDGGGEGIRGNGRGEGRDRLLNLQWRRGEEPDKGRTDRQALDLGSIQESKF